MRLSSLWHFLAVFVGIVGFAAAITGWIIKDKVLFGLAGSYMADKATMVILMAIWMALVAVIHIAKEDKED